MSSSEPDKLAEILKERGYSITGQRKLVLEALYGKEPMTMHELIGEIEGKMDRASVYRTITLFEQLGIVQRLNYGWKYKVELTDIFEEHHHHMTCVKCHKVIPISEKEMEDFIKKLADKNGFNVTTHQIEIQGLCKNCR